VIVLVLLLAAGEEGEARGGERGEHDERGERGERGWGAFSPDHGFLLVVRGAQGLPGERPGKSSLGEMVSVRRAGRPGALDFRP